MPGEAGKGVPEERPCLAELEVGQEWEMTHVARLPMCHLLRPSSHPGSATPFRVKHQIAVDVVYTVVPNDPMAPLPSPRQLRISKNVHIHGCAHYLSVRREMVADVGAQVPVSIQQSDTSDVRRRGRRRLSSRPLRLSLVRHLLPS